MTDKKITDLFSLEGKVVVIVGGKGVYGNALTEAFAKAGARVFTGARRLEPLEANAASLRAEGYDAVSYTHLDVYKRQDHRYPLRMLSG